MLEVPLELHQERSSADSCLTVGLNLESGDHQQNVLVALERQGKRINPNKYEFKNDKAI